jgi:hypothetical protein
MVAMATTLFDACSNNGKNIFLSLGTKYWKMLFSDMFNDYLVKVSLIC